jgi:hypothetical protein
VRPEVLFCCRVQHTHLERSTVRTPIAEKHFADVHVVLVGEFQVEYAEAELLRRQVCEEVMPGFLLLADAIKLLNGTTVTTTSFSILKTKYLASIFLNLNSLKVF